MLDAARVCPALSQFSADELDAGFTRRGDCQEPGSGSGRCSEVYNQCRRVGGHIGRTTDDSLCSCGDHLVHLAGVEQASLRHRDEPAAACGVRGNEVARHIDHHIGGIERKCVDCRQPFVHGDDCPVGVGLAGNEVDVGHGGTRSGGLEQHDESRCSVRYADHREGERNDVGRQSAAASGGDAIGIRRYGRGVVTCATVGESTRRVEWFEP